MLKIYSVKYLKHNRTSSLFIMTSAFISSLLLSLIGGIAYNIWADHKYQLFLKTGGSYETPTLLALACGLILSMVSLSLIMMLHSAFEVTMNVRLHQLGILQSVGASPGQIRAALTNEILILSLLPLAAGNLAGIGLTRAFIEFFIKVTENIRKYQVFFRYSQALLLVTLFLSLLTIALSAWIPARKMSRTAPLEAIRCGGEPSVKKMRRFHLMGRLFGIEGELAGKSLYAKRKAFRTSTVSITLSFLAVITFFNLERISGLSTQKTYFQKYGDKWDFLLTAEEMEENGNKLLDELRGIDGVRRCTGYKKVKADVWIPQNLFSGRLQTAGIENLNRNIKAGSEGDYLVKAPILVLDDESFDEYARTAEPGNLQKGPGVIAVNQIWDSRHSRWMEPSYIPFLDEEKEIRLELAAPDGEKEGIPLRVTGFSSGMPELKEAFAQYSLTLILSQQAYREIERQFPAREIYYNIKIEPGPADEKVQREIELQMEGRGGYILDSRMEEERSELVMRRALRIFMGTLAGILACIGLANVFSNTLGQVHQRKKEFARYLSLGLSRRGFCRIMALEAWLVCARPLGFSLLVNIPLTAWVLDISPVTAEEYLRNAPYLSAAIFTAFIAGSVALAYYLGAREIDRGGLMEALKDDAMI